MRQRTRGTVLEWLEPRRLLSSYYVSPSGLDTNPGTAASPWKTLQKAADSVVAGDVVNAQPGTYSVGFVLGWDAPTAGTFAAPITFQADPASAPGSVVISGRNNKTADGIDLEDSCDWIVIKGFLINNAASSITRAGIRISGSDNVSVLNNTTTSCQGFGIFSSFATDLLIQGNTVTNTIGGSSTTGHGIYVSNSAVNPVVRGNLIANNANQGLQFNGDLSQGGTGLVTGAIVEQNIIRNSGSNGMNCDGLQNSRIQNNLIYDNSSNGITLFKIDGADGSKNNVIVNNTFYAPSSSGAAVRIKDGSTGNKVYNNVLIGGSGSIRISNDSISGLVNDYNAVMDSFVSEDTGIPETLTDWRTQTGQDQHSFIATGAELFVNASAHDYHLSPSSPAIDGGTNLASPNQAPLNDLEGNPRPSGANWDIGAFEHSSTPDTTPPTLTAITATDIQGNKATITWTTDEPATSQVDFGISGYTDSSPVDLALVTSHGVTLTGLSATTQYHYRVRSQDASGNPSTSDDFTFTTGAADTTPPTFSNVSFTNLNPNSTTISWTTNESADSQATYGFSSYYGNSSALNSTMTTSHTVTLTGLVPDTLYHVQLLSRDDASNLGSTADLTFTTSAANPIPSGAVAYWPFNESSGTTTADSTGNSHTGTLNNGAAFTTAGQTGNAVSFDGVNDSVRIPRAASLEPAVVSLAAWIKISSGAIETDWASIIKKTYGNDSAEPWGSYGLQLSPSGHDNMLGFFTGVQGSDGDTLESPSQIPTGQWVHVAATYDPQAAEKKLYVNGVLVASKTVSFPLVYDKTSSGDIYLGQDPGPGEAFAGTIDNVGIWNRVLTPADISGMVYKTVSQAVNGTTANDSILVTRTAAQQVQVQVGHQTAVTIDLTSVNNVQINGNSGTDTILFSGLSGDDDVLINPTDVRFGSTLITETSIEKLNFDGGGGNDRLSINGTTVKFINDQILAGLSITNSGTLNLVDTTLVLTYSPGASPMASIASLIQSGWNGGAWDGAGIVTSLGDTAHLGIGYLDNSAQHQIVAKATYYGDATVDGVVNSLDFDVLASNFDGSGKTWADGDFNFDGVVNALDFNALATNFGGGSSAGTTLSVNAGSNDPRKQPRASVAAAYLAPAVNDPHDNLIARLDLL